MTKDLTVRQRTAEYLDRIQGEILSCAAREYSQREFINSALFLISTREDLLAAMGTPEGQISMRNALSHAATLGLSLNPSLGESTLVVYNGQVRYQPMKNGLVKLALETGVMEVIGVETVHEKDSFTIQKTSHGDDFNFIPALVDRGKPIGYFAFARLKSGTTHLLWRTRQEIEQHRDRYCRPPRKHPELWTWKTSFDGMAGKTVLRQLINTIRVSPILGKALQFDSESEIEISVQPPRLPRGGVTANDIKGELAAKRGSEQENDFQPSNSDADESAIIEAETSEIIGDTDY